MSAPILVWSLFIGGLCFGLITEAVMRPARRRPFQWDTALLFGLVRGENSLIAGVLLIMVTNSISWVTVGLLIGMTGLAVLTRAERLKSSAARPSWMVVTWFIIIGVWLMLIGMSSPLIAAGDESWRIVVTGFVVILGLSMLCGAIAGYIVYRMLRPAKTVTGIESKEYVAVQETRGVDS